jgi:hypothetical protein
MIVELPYVVKLGWGSDLSAPLARKGVMVPISPFTCGSVMNIQSDRCLKPT